MLRAYIAAGVLAAIIAAFFFGYRQGSGACEAKRVEEVAQAQAATIRAANEAASRELRRLVAEAEAEALARQLEEQAYADLPSDGCGIDTERVRRLNRF